MAAEALRRLRDEINAAFDTQGQVSSRRRTRETCNKHLTPKWAEVTALLASVGRLDLKNAHFDAEEGDLGSLRPAKSVHKDEKWTVSEKRKVLRNCWDEWRRVAHAAAFITRMQSRARRRRELRLVEKVFILWRRRVYYQLELKAKTDFVKEKTRFLEMKIVWNKWTCTQQRALRWREFCLRRRRRLSYEAFCAWVWVVNQHRRYRRCLRKAKMQFLRRYWRWLTAAIEMQRMINCKVRQLRGRRLLKLTDHAFSRWVEYVEQLRRWNFAVRWSDRRVLGDVFDNWIKVCDNARRTRNALQLAIRHRRRGILRGVLKAWGMYSHYVQKQKQALVVVMHTQQCRGAFTRLIFNARCYKEKEHSLLVWKMRQTVWTWFHCANRDRMLRLRAEFLRKSHGRLILRTGAWRQWRRKYLCSIAMKTFFAKQRAKQLQNFWLAFVAAVSKQEHQRQLIESFVDTREIRELRGVMDTWRVHARSCRHNKKLIESSAVFCRRMLLRNTISRWRVAHEVVRRRKFLDALAIKYLARKLIKHWAKWAYWSKRDLGTKISVVKKYWHQRQAQKCIDHWRRIIHVRQRKLRMKFLNVWKLWIEIQNRNRHLLELRRLVQLRRLWQRWNLFAVYCLDIRAKAHEVQKRHHERLLKYSFASVWLFKTRRYNLGSTILTVLADQRLLRRTLLRWRHNCLRLNAMRLASAFSRKNMQTHYLRLLFELTIGQKHTAIVYNRRRYLIRTWDSWNAYFTLKQRQREADMYFRRRSKQKAVSLLHIAAVNSMVRRNQRLDAESWYEAALLQKVLSKWFAAAKHACYCRSLGQHLVWDVVGKRIFRVWYDNWMERQKMVTAAQFHDSALVRRSWNMIFRVTRRRQVALAMWSHTMISVRLSHVFIDWKKYADDRRGRYAVAVSICRMQEMRTRQKFFTAWALLITAQKLALRFEQLDLLKWEQKCWNHWKLWRIFCRLQGIRELILLRKTFSQGFKGYAIQQQACREVYLRTARSLLHRSLVQWRIEWWVVYNQKKLSMEMKRNALMHWKTFVAACRQKRRWECYVHQLHRSQSRLTLDNKHRTANTFCDTRALQAQLKRYRVLMTHVLHAWYLVVQNRHYRDQCRSLAMSTSTKWHRRRNTEVSHASSTARKKALDFWALRLMEKSFLSWRELSSVKA